MTNTFLLLILHCIYVQIVGGWLLQSRCLLRSASASLPLSTRRCGGAITSPVVKDWKPHHKKSWSMYMIDKSHSEPPDEGEGGESEEGDANIAPKEKAVSITTTLV